MVKAKIVGENHASSKNVEELKRIFESGCYDALFIEGREDKIFEEDTKISLSYIFFLLGWVEWLLIRKFYASKKSIYDSAKKRGIPVFGSMDASIPKIFNMGNRPIKRFLFPILFLIFSFMIFYNSDIWCKVISYLFLFLFPILSFSLVVSSANEKRDHHMANSIIEKIKASKFSNVLISCGNAHVSGIAENLRLAGIEVDTIKRGRWSFLKHGIILIPILLLINNYDISHIPNF